MGTVRLAALLLVLAAVAATAAAPAQAGCVRGGYAYAGLQSVHRAHGIRAWITARTAPRVRNGHVAAWVGVGGRGLGPGGSDEWLQAGLSAFSDGPGKLYFEVARPGRAPLYTEVLARVRPGRRYSVAVLETSARRDWWRVWVNGEPVSAPIHLPGSSARFRPMAVAESWNRGRGACNGFEYAFERVQVARGAGGSWAGFVGGHRWQDPGHRVLRRSQGSFVARAVA